MILDVDTHRLELPDSPAIKLRPKAFRFLCFLALRSTDGTDGLVAVDEIVARVPGWQDASANEAGKQIERYCARYRWFGKCVWWELITRGPYRFRGSVSFKPNRDAANLALVPLSGKRAKRRLTDTELAAFHLLAQYGVYAPPIVDFILQRLGDPESIIDGHDRLSALRVLVTIAKNRGQTERARTLAQPALALARQLDRSDDVAYLLDQLGCIADIDGRHDEAIRYFQEEIEFLNELDSPRAAFHLVGAYRGLALALRQLGKKAEALEAIQRSYSYAEQSGNEQGLHLARLARTKIDADRGKLSIADVLRKLPAGHPIAYLMLLNTLAERFLAKGNREDGEELLRIAFRDASEFALCHVLETTIGIAKKFAVELDTQRAAEAG